MPHTRLPLSSLSSRTLTIHRGNEECKKKNPDCVALYGAGVIAMTFKWDYFDAIAFMITANDGFPMSIVDMADKVKTDGEAGANATLKCGKSGYNPAFADAMNEPDPNACYKPQFLWHGDLVTLPYLNEKASVIKTRMITDKGEGDCKMVSP